MVRGAGVARCQGQRRKEDGEGQHMSQARHDRASIKLRSGLLLSDLIDGSAKGKGWIAHRHAVVALVLLALVAPLHWHP